MIFSRRGICRGERAGINAFSQDQHKLQKPPPVADCDLSVKKDFVKIEGEYAIYQNSWMAGGNKITWDIIHYQRRSLSGAVAPVHLCGPGYW